MLEGWLEAGAEASEFSVIRPSGRPVGHGIRVTTVPPEGEAPGIVMLGMKPHQLDEVVPVLAPILQPHTILISILAGVEAASLRERFPAPRTIVRAMPNLPVRLRKGVTNLYSDAPEAAARVTVSALIEALGLAEWLEDEQAFQVAGHLTGAGPAFLYRFIDALAAAGEELGLGQDQALRLATAMTEGASALAAVSPDKPETLARRVASPGGTTEAGLKVLDEEGALKALLHRTLDASRLRSLEMAAEARARPR
jgi:pyrroline-5-carboxylate reductase